MADKIMSTRTLEARQRGSDGKWIVVDNAVPTVVAYFHDERFSESDARRFVRAEAMEKALSEGALIENVNALGWPKVNHDGDSVEKYESFADSLRNLKGLLAENADGYWLEFLEAKASDIESALHFDGRKSND